MTASTACDDAWVRHALDRAPDMTRDQVRALAVLLLAQPRAARPA